MLKTRRQIITEQDRFGGYSLRQPVREQPSKNRYEILDESEFVRDEKPYYEESSHFDARSDSRVSERERESSLYSSRGDYEYETAEYVEQPVHTRVPRRRKREMESMMPSIRTRAVRDAEKTQSEEAGRAKQSSSSKTKTMLAVYAAVVVVLAAIVIATGIAIGSASASVASLEAELQMKNEIVLEKSAELAALENDTTIAGIATENGMVKPVGKTEIELLPMNEAVRYEAVTNWFDKLCDWLSNLIGG